MKLCPTSYNHNLDYITNHRRTMELMISISVRINFDSFHYEAYVQLVTSGLGDWLMFLNCRECWKKKTFLHFRDG